uniref:Polyketide synthase n=1 Tax=Pestalotiopsis microspora TaxID=85828 RepID=A0A1P8NTK5_PESMI|nr:polyketide synthase [Pestalotiopsis microspora]
MTTMNGASPLPEPIAIVGTGCRFPGGANSPSALWKLLEKPRDICQEIPADRFNTTGFYHRDGTRHGTTNVRHTYLLDEDVRVFDAGFFNISPNEADSIDPQQRLLLETVYEALEVGGHTLESLRGSDTAVYVGTMGVDYHETLLRDLDVIPAYFATSTNRAILSNRISYFFDWHGPSITIDTACSSSLIAVHQGVQALRNGDSRVAVACGAQITLGHEMYIVESKLKMLSPTGRSRMWDADADGYARGEGVSAIVMKRLSDAIADGDYIECLIRGTGTNQDGFSGGLTVPNTEAQTALIHQTYAKAGLDPVNNPNDRPQFFEAHGTGTQVGDPKEAAAIYEAFGRHIHQEDKIPLYVGSVKTVVGHLEGAAGLAGLLKASLSIQKAQIVPNLLFNRLNPRIEPFYKGLVIPTSITSWPELANGVPRRASVNSFGFGGTNAHVILEEYIAPQSPQTGPTTQSLIPFVFSATSEKSLVSSLEQYSAFLKTSDGKINASDLAWTLQSHRSQLPVKIAFSALSTGDLSSKIDDKLSVLRENPGTAVGTRTARRPGPPQILGIFTGQGAQWPAMGAQLLHTSSFVRQRIRQLEESLASLPQSDRPKWSLRDELCATADASRVAEAELSQPLCTAVQIVLVDLLRRAGINFSAVVGHSSGEIAAAYAADFISSHDAIRIAFYRGLYAYRAGDGKKGGMLAVGTSLEDAQDLLDTEAFEGRIAIAAHNSPASVTLSGDADAIVHAQKVFQEEKKFARLLKVEIAYHSHHMLPCGNPYIEALRACGIQVNRDRSDDSCAWYSSVIPSETPMQCIDALQDTYWKDNMANPVLFADAVKNAVANNEHLNLALEVGPHPALKGPAMQNISDARPAGLPYSGVLTRGNDDVESLLDAAGFVWTLFGAQGVDLQFYERTITNIPPAHKLLVDLPTYQWDHGRIHWTESRRSRRTRGRKDAPHELLGSPSPDSNAYDMRWHNILRLTEIPWLAGHQLQGQTVFPAAGYVAMAVEASRSIAANKQIELIELRDLQIPRAITFEEEENSLGVETMVTMTDIKCIGDESVTAHCSIYAYPVISAGTDHDLELMARCSVTVALGDPSSTTLPCHPAEDYNMSAVDVDRFYSALTELGYGYSGPFRTLSSMRRRLNHASAFVDDYCYTEDDSTLYLVHPTMLDVAFQSSMLAYSAPGDERLWSLHVPTSIGSIVINPALCPSWPNSGPRLPLRATLDDSAPYSANIEVLSENSQHCMIQVEDLVIEPFAPGTEADDRKLFSYTKIGLGAPDGQSVMESARPSADEVELMTVRERIAYYYLHRWRDEITEEEWQGAFPHLYNFLKHTLDLVSRGQHPTVQERWAQDESDLIQSLISKHWNDIDIRLVAAVGDNLAAAARGETSMLEHMMYNGLLDDFYRHSLGCERYNAFLGAMAKQISHRYPHANILEIGAGTGSATRAVLEATGGKLSSYTFTDISAGFFAKAAEVFKVHSDKMTFKVFDAEKTPASQGYEPYSYDVIVASNVLHATASLQKTLAHTRQLLKPGGYLLLLEITENDPIYGSTVFGALPGWWLGVDDGRKFAPTVTPREWHSVLRKVGFGGIDAITPKIEGSVWPFSVIASQAIDAQVTFLRRPLSSPLPFAPIESLVILGTGTLESAQIAEDLSDNLGRFCLKTTILEALPTQAEALDLSSSSTFINLVDLDSPIFKNFTFDKMEGLRRVFELARHVIWVTHRAMTEEPYHMASLAFSRSISNEAAHISLNMLDIADLNPGVASVIAEQLLRQCALEEFNHDSLLWSKEPETLLQGGNLLIPRLIHNTEQNARLNSTRRHITKSVPFLSSNIAISQSSASHYRLVDDSSPQIVRSDDRLSIRAEASTLMALRMDVDALLFLSIGQDATTGDTAVNASVTNTQVAKPAASVRVEGDNALPALDFLLAVTGEILAESLISELPARSSILVHCSNHHQSLALALSRQAAVKNIRVVLSTDSENDDNLSRDKSNCHWIKLASHTPRHAFQKTLLALGPTHYLDLSPGDVSQKIAAHILPSGCKVIDVSTLFQMRSALPPSVDLEAIQTRLKKAIDAARTTSTTIYDKELLQKCAISVNAVPEREASLNDAATVVQWPTQGQGTIEVRPLDPRQLFSKDKTYVLFGLSGQLGQSLCDWMVSQGAGCVCLTSRNPKIDPRWLASFELTPSKVKVFSMDVTIMKSVTDVIKTIRETCPPIAGIVHGAMVLSDALFASMSFDQMQTVLGPKIDGANNLNQAFYDDDLDFFILLSSGAGVVGNSGQSNYAATSGYLNGLARQRRSRGLAASTIDIGMVTGIGYVETAGQHVVDQLGKYGLSILSEPDFRLAFAETVRAGYPSPKDRFNIPDAVITTGIRTMLDGETNVTWRNNPIFSHCIITELKGDRDGVAGQSRSRVAAVPLMEQISKTSSKEKALGVIKECFLAKLRVILQNAALELDDGAPLVEVGIDSLVAVEVRSWFLKELKVDVPVLKIVGGASLVDLCEFATNKLLDKILPSEEKGNATAPALATTLPKSKSLVPPPLPSSVTSSRLDSENGSTPADAVTPSLSVTEPSSKSPSEIDVLESNNASQALPEVPMKSVVPKTIVRRAELTPGQLGHIRLIKLLQDSAHLNIACLIKVEGVLKAERLAEAAHIVSRRHEALRTSFIGEESENTTMQAIFAETGILVDHGVVNDEVAAQETYARLEKHEFDLKNGECMRISILHLSPDVNFVIIVWNHLIMDGASFEVFWADLMQVYCGNTLPASPPQYADYTKKQLEDIRDGLLSEQIDFWQQKLSVILDQGPLPLLPFADRLKANAFHFYFAVFKVMLTKLLELEGKELCIGMANAGRFDKNTMGSIGNYANALPIVFQKSKKSQTFPELLRETRTEVLKALANSQVPYDMLLEELQVPRSASYSPMYQAFINYRSGAKERRSLGNAQAEFMNWSGNKAGYDIILDIVDNPGGQAIVSMEVQKGLYSEEEAVTLLEVYSQLLEAVVSAPTSPLRQLSMYTKQDEQRALKAGRGEIKEMKDPQISTLVHQTEDMVQRYPHRTALRDSSGACLTFSDMAKRVNAIAAALASKNLPIGSVIGAFQHPTVDWACSMLASMRLGFVHLSLDPRFPATRLRDMTEECCLAAVIVNYTSENDVGILGLPDDLVIKVEHCPDTTTLPPIVATPDMLATLMYTSGSTGKPKGFLLKHEGLLNEVQDSIECFQMTPNDVTLQQSAITFDAALWEIFIAIASGGASVIVSKDHRVDPEAVTSLLSSQGVTVAIATPTEYSLWIRDGSIEDFKQAPLRLVCATGEMLSRAHSDMILDLQIPGLRLNNAYGPSETSIVISKTDIEPSHAINHGRRIRNPVGYTGKNRSIYIVDSELRLLPVGFSGEVVVGGCGVGVGYLHREALTAEKFVHDPWAAPEQRARGWTRMYHTGDRGFLDENGCLTLESRMLGDTELKLRGIRMDVQDVEKAIIDTANGAISDAVVSVRGEPDAQYLVAHLIYDDKIVPQGVQKDYYSTHIVSRLPLPQYMRPGIAVPTKEFPMNRNGKLDRAEVAALPIHYTVANGRQSLKDYNVLSDTEQQLRELWLTLLPSGATEVFDLSHESDFLSIGGDSGSLVRLHRLIRETFQVTFPLIHLFECSTLRAMSAKIQDECGQAARSINWDNETAISPIDISTRAAQLLQLQPAQSMPSSTAAKVVVLTGATGNLSSVLLLELAKNDEIGEIHCLAIRNMEKAKAILDNAGLSPQQRRKIYLYAGDLTAPRLGVPDVDFARLMRTTDSIVHIAAARAFWDDYYVLRANNVSSVHGLLLLATPRKIPIHFMSSGGVTRFAEAVATPRQMPPTDGSDGYVSGKWAVERILESAARGLQLPVNIYRTVHVKHDEGDCIRTQKVLEAFENSTRDIAALPADSAAAWDGHVDLLKLSTVAENITRAVIADKTGQDSAIGHAPLFVVNNYNAESRVTIRQVLSHLQTRMGQKPEGFQHIEVLEWMGRLKRAGFPYMLASFSLTYNSGEQSKPLALER